MPNKSLNSALPWGPRHKRKRGGQPLVAGAAVIVALLLLGAVLAFHYTTEASGSAARSVATPATQPAIAATTPPSPSPSPSASSSQINPAVNPLVVYALKTKFPKSGPGSFRFASTTGPVLGTAGPIRRFRLAIESNVSNKIVDMSALTAKVDVTLGDARSWVGSRQYRLQQVAESAAHEFTIYLSTPQTVNHLCAPLPTGGYTSCRQGAKVVLNLARWMTSVPYYTNDKVVLDTYRTYMINHEVGHALGHGHELCPSVGKPAPVMEQQTLGLHGCEPNPWVFVHGKKYDGPPGTY